MGRHLLGEESEAVLCCLPGHGTQPEMDDQAANAGLLHCVQALSNGFGRAPDQVIAWLIDPAAEDPNAGRQAIRAGTAGLVLSRRDRLYVQPGDTLAKVVGREPLTAPKEKNLLGD